MRDYLMDIFFSREAIENRSITGMTGEVGLLAFHNAVANVAAPFLTLDTHFIRDGKSIGATPGLEFGKHVRRA